MDLKQRITEDMKTAQKEGDKTKLSVIRLLKSEIRYKEIEKKKELSDEEILEVLSSAIKKRKESIEQFKKGGREELVAQEKKELDLILSYMPEQLSEQELDKIIDEVIRELGAEAPSDVGKVMKVLMPKIKGRAEGRVANLKVSLRLQAS